MFMVRLPFSDEELLGECEIESFRSTGKGGQHVNKTDSAVRLKHLPSGVTVIARQERSQYLNKLIALRKLREKVALLNYRPPKRVPTKMPKSAREKILRTKAQVSRKKKLRSTRPEME